MGAKLTKDEIARRNLELLNRGIELLGDYKGSHVKHKFRCTSEKHEWETLYYNVFHCGKSCIYCPRKIIYSSYKHGHNEPNLFQRDKIKFLERGIEILEDYKGSQHKHKFRCVNKSHTWDARYYTVKRGIGCPECSGKYISPEEINRRKEFLELRGIELIEPFKRVYLKHWFRCKAEGHKWNAIYNSVYRGSGCPWCSGHKVTEEDKLRNKAHRAVRTRYRTLYNLGLIPTKIYKNKDGTYNDILDFAADHYYEFIKANPKPTTPGKWEIDHIVPLSWFNPYDRTELELCWHVNNLQWLTKPENCSKNDRIRPQDLASLTLWHYDAIAQCSYPKPLPIAVA
jgi:hypothetical protein